MTLAFSLAFFGGLAWQFLTLRLSKKVGLEGHMWGIYFNKFVAFPIWFALSMAGPLGVVPGIVVFFGSLVVVSIVFIVYYVILGMKDPDLLEGYTQETPEAERFKKIQSNYMSFTWGMVLLVCSIAGAIGLM